MKSRSLKQKLTIRSSITLALVFLSFLAFYFFHQYLTMERRVEKIRQVGEISLIEKGRLLVQDKNTSLRVMLYENSWIDIRSIIAENVKDKDIVLGCLVRKGYDLRVWATKDNPKGEIYEPGTRDLVGPLKHLQTNASGQPILENDTTHWAFGLEHPDFRTHTEDGKTYYEFGSPIYITRDEDGETGPVEEKEAAVFFRLSTTSMEEGVDSERNEYRSQQNATLALMSMMGGLALLIGFLFTRSQAATITQPLGVLTQAATSISDGNYDVKVTITSGDEIETLAHAFNQMVRDLARSYEDLQTRNRQLEEARLELEDLNRDLESKVERRTHELAESESKFRTLFVESADAILLGDSEQFLDCNPAMLAIMGATSKHQLLALSLDDISPELQPDGDSSREKFQNHLRQAETTSCLFEWVSRRIDGEAFYSEIVMTSFPLNNKQIVHMVFRDISERKRTEAALKEAQQKLVETAHSAGMAEIATGVLHNIGNILNSVNISTEEISHTLKASKIKGFLKANDLVERNSEDLTSFLTDHPKGKLIPGYYVSLGEAIKEEHQLMTDEIRALGDKISMMRDVISTQQNYAKATLYTEDVAISDLVDDALKLQLASLKKQGVKIRKDFRAHPRGMVSKVKLVHVLTNLIKNGKEAMEDNEVLGRTQELVIRIEEPEDNMVQIQIEDNGCGIQADHLEKIFNHGFTTKSTGHGFGLHTCANFMTEMGGSMLGRSEGLGLGSQFILRFPLHRYETSTH